MVLIDSHRYSTHAGAHIIYLTVVMNALILDGHIATQSCVLKEGLFMKYHKYTTIDKPSYIFWKINRPKVKSICRFLLTGIPNLRSHTKRVAKISHFCIEKLVSSAYSRPYCNVTHIQIQLDAWFLLHIFSIRNHRMLNKDHGCHAQIVTPLAPPGPIVLCCKHNYSFSNYIYYINIFQIRLLLSCLCLMSKTKHPRAKQEIWLISYLTSLGCIIVLYFL